MLRTRKIFFALLLILTAAVFAGCRSSRPGQPEPSAAPVQSGQEPDEPSSGAQKDEPDADTVTVVRGDTSPKAVTDAAVALRSELEALGVPVDIKTDWVKRGEEMVRFPNEILIGETNRSESEALNERLNGEGGPYDYIFTVGAENCIAAQEECIGEAAALFAAEYARHLSGGGEGTAEFSRKHEFERKLVVAGYEYVFYTCETGSSEPEKYAGSELRKYLRKIGLYEGDGARFRIAIDFHLSRDSYTIASADDGTVTITGGNGRGVIYGVYAFLEKYAGARFFMPGLETLGSGDVTVDAGFSHEMIFEMRQSDWQCGNSDVDWCLKNCVNQRDIPSSKGGSIKYGGFVHTAASLTGVGANVQPCFSDPEILDKAIANVRALLAADSSITIVSVSQNDNTNYCTCKTCSAIDREEGSHMGSLLRFVHAVAEDIEDDYPNVIIDTLAYQHTRQAPKITKPRDNVCIRLCSIECCFCHPLNDPDCKENAAFAKDIEDWSRICDRIYIWDYVTCFSYYVQTFPNFGVLRENMRFFAEHGVKGMYPEGNYNSPQSGEFGELRCWLLAKLMADPMMSEEEYQRCTDEFLEAYYGEGWTYIRDYLDWFVGEASSNKKHMNIWNPILYTVPKNRIQSMRDTLEEDWDKAEALAGDRIDAVKRSRLQWELVKLMLKADPEKAKAFYDGIQKQNVMWQEWNALPGNYNPQVSALQW